MWKTRTFGWSVVSSIAIWLAFPPVGCWPLAWIAPYGWLRVIRSPRLDGRRPYLAIYLVGYGHWLLMTQWVRLPHWSAAIGWLFLAAYLALYVLAFIALARWLVHRAGWSPVLAAPLAWVSAEVARSHLLTGFALVPLSHTQVDFLPVLQIADLAGAYGVSFLIVLVAATIEHIVGIVNKRRVWVDWWPAASTVLLSSLCLGYGNARLSEIKSDRQSKVAIIQGSYDTIFDNDVSRYERSFANYCRMTYDATARGDIDLVVWPESMFLRYRLVEGLDTAATAVDQQLTSERRYLLRKFGTHCLMGTGMTRYVEGEPQRFNTAAFFDANGDLVDAYHKMHPVMFGEYVPLGDVFPWLYSLTPNGSGLTAGTEPKALAAGQLLFAPNICFENTVPHLIRRQVKQLEQAGSSVDALVTLTNDGWFWGSSLLDLHLACGIYRAVENRKPCVIAANTGFSAHVASNGRVLRKGPRRSSKALVTNVHATGTRSLYTQYGDWFACLCLLLCSGGVTYGWRRRKA